MAVHPTDMVFYPISVKDSGFSLTNKDVGYIYQGRSANYVEFRVAND